MASQEEGLATALFSEILMLDQIARTILEQALPRGMELSQFMVLNHLARATAERTPAQLAASFNRTRGAMTNTLARLEASGHIHIRPDWDDARRKLVSISTSGRAARDAAMRAMSPAITDLVERVGAERVRSALPILRQLRAGLGSG